MFIFANIIDAIALISHALINAYILVVLAACVVTWFHVSQYNTIVRVIDQLTAPLFIWVRKKLPMTSVGGLDFSPVVVIVGLELIDLVVVRSIRQLAAGI